MCARAGFTQGDSELVLGFGLGMGMYAGVELGR